MAIGYRLWIYFAIDHNYIGCGVLGDRVYMLWKLLGDRPDKVGGFRRRERAHIGTALQQTA